MSPGPPCPEQHTCELPAAAHRARRACYTRRLDVGLPMSLAEGRRYAITPESPAAAAAGGAGTMTVTAAPGCPWTTSSNVNWLTVSPGAGSGPGPLSFNVTPTT